MRIFKLALIVLSGIAALATAAVLTGCGSNEAPSADEGNTTDAAFVVEMTTHHRGAIEMAEIARTGADHAEIKKLAGQIIAAQKGEITVMTRIGQELRAHGMTGGSMGMSDAEMGMNMAPAALNTADPFDRAFIDMMIPHHRGAIAMAKSLLAKGTHSTLRKMARDIITAQTKEIELMQSWRQRWYGERPSVEQSMGGDAHGMEADEMTEHTP